MRHVQCIGVESRRPGEGIYSIEHSGGCLRLLEGSIFAGGITKWPAHTAANVEDIRCITYSCRSYQRAASWWNRIQADAEKQQKG